LDAEYYVETKKRATWWFFASLVTIAGSIYISLIALLVVGGLGVALALYSLYLTLLFVSTVIALCRLRKTECRFAERKPFALVMLSVLGARWLWLSLCMFAISCGTAVFMPVGVLDAIVLGQATTALVSVYFESSALDIKVRDTPRRL
jgi:hypothetical protein